MFSKHFLEIFLRKIAPRSIALLKTEIDWELTKKYLSVPFFFLFWHSPLGIAEINSWMRCTLICCVSATICYELDSEAGDVDPDLKVYDSRLHIEQKCPIQNTKKHTFSISKSTKFQKVFRKFYFFINQFGISMARWTGNRLNLPKNHTIPGQTWTQVDWNCGLAGGSESSLSRRPLTNY